MKNSKILQSGIILLLAIHTILSEAQIIVIPDPKATFDRSNGILVISASMKGSFYLDDHLMTELKETDPVYIINLKPGKYEAKMVFNKEIQKTNVTIQGWKVTEIRSGADSMHIKDKAFLYDDIREKVTGKKVLFLHECYFNITQISFYSSQFGESKVDGVKNWFSSITTINGFQGAPGFSAGVGISINNYNIPAVYDSRSFYSNPASPQTFAVINNVSFLPVFLDVRSHFSNGRVAPFVKVDIGYNILLSKKSISVYEPFNIGGRMCSVQMTGGGIFFSPGIGCRISVSKLVQIIASAEYSYETSMRTLDYGSTKYAAQSSGINWFKFSIGIGFQKR